MQWLDLLTIMLYQKFPQSGCQMVETTAGGLLKKMSIFILKKKVPPDHLTWTKHKVELEKFCKTLETARKLAENDSYTSTEECAARRIKKKKFDDEWMQNYSDSEEEPSKRRRITAPPQIDNSTPVVLVEVLDCEDMNSTESKRIEDAEGNQIRELNTPLSTATTVSVDNSSISENSSLLNCILDVVTEVKLQVNELSQKLLILHQKREGNVEDKISKLIPVEDLDSLEVLETFLLDEENKKLFRNYISVIGGNGPKDHTVRTLARIYGDSLAILCSWQGLRNNKRMCDIKSMNIIKDVIITNYLVREKEFESIAAEWFRHARQRLMRKRNNAC